MTIRKEIPQQPAKKVTSKRLSMALALVSSALAVVVLFAGQYILALALFVIAIINSRAYVKEKGKG
jgi:hypothetical protein